VAIWLWVPGAPGSPQNEGWLDVLAYSPRPSNDMSCSVRLDSAYPSLMQIMVKATQVDGVVLYHGPHREYRMRNASSRGSTRVTKS
jgi:hypothetical protein